MNLETIQAFFSRYLEALWVISVELAPFLLLGLFLAGLLEVIFPAHKVFQWLGFGQRFAVLRAAFIGVPLPLCSCGVVPVALSLRRRGASRGATISFLVTTPQSGVDSIAATWALMGPLFAFLRTALTFVSGLIAGFLVQQFDEDKTVQEKPNSQQALKETKTVFQPFLTGLQILRSIKGSLLVGLVLAALIEVTIPNNLVSETFLSGFMGMITLIVIGLPLYVCATASIPLAMEFVNKGFSPGAAFVFLLVGPATNMATALIVRKEIGSKAMAIYLMSLVGCSLAAGLLIDFLGVKIPLLQEAMHHHESLGFSEILTFVLIGLIAYLYIQPLLSSKQTEDFKNQTQLNVSGMSCANCKNKIEKAVNKIPGVKRVAVDLKNHQVMFEGGDTQQVRQAIVDAGYDLV